MFSSRVSLFENCFPGLMKIKTSHPHICPGSVYSLDPCTACPRVQNNTRPNPKASWWRGYHQRERPRNFRGCFRNREQTPALHTAGRSFQIKATNGTVPHQVLQEQVSRGSRMPGWATAAGPCDGVSRVIHTPPLLPDWGWASAALYGLSLTTLYRDPCKGSDSYPDSTTSSPEDRDRNSKHTHTHQKNVLPIHSLFPS